MGIGLVAMTLILVHLYRALARGRDETLADSMREATVRQVEALKAELLSLRKLYLLASKPVRMEIPARILPHAPPLTRRFRGETARELASARARLEELHGLWRSLEQALTRSDIARSQDGWYSSQGVEAGLEILERVPLRNLPVSTIRKTAQRFEAIASSPLTCSALLEGAARRLDVAEGDLDRLLLAGQSSRSLDEEFATLVESVVEAAFFAQADPIGASQIAKQAYRLGEDLTEQVDKTLTVVAGRKRALDTMAELDFGATEVSASDPARDAETLFRWSVHLAERSTQALDDGERELAVSELSRARALVKDAKSLSNGGANSSQTELTRLRGGLKKGHKALDELQAEFAPQSWIDLESCLHRAAARIELLDAALGEGTRVPRVAARLYSIRQATLAASSRLLQARAERERVHGLLESLQARAQAIGGYLDREADAVSERTHALFSEVAEQLEELAKNAKSEESPPVWGDLLLSMLVIEQELHEVQVRAGEDVLRSRRAWTLKRSLEKTIRDGEDLLRRRTTRPGASNRLEGAR